MIQFYNEDDGDHILKEGEEEVWWSLADNGN